MHLVAHDSFRFVNSCQQTQPIIDEGSASAALCQVSHSPNLHGNYLMDSQETNNSFQFDYFVF